MKEIRIQNLSAILLAVTEMKDEGKAMKKYLFVVTLLAALALVLGGCEIQISGNGVTNPGSTAIPSSGSAQFGKQTKTSGCLAHGGLPD